MVVGTVLPMNMEEILQKFTRRVRHANPYSNNPNVIISLSGIGKDSMDFEVVDLLTEKTWSITLREDEVIEYRKERPFPYGMIYDLVTELDSINVKIKALDIYYEGNDRFLARLAKGSQAPGKVLFWG